MKKENKLEIAGIIFHFKDSAQLRNKITERLTSVDKQLSAVDPEAIAKIEKERDASLKKFKERWDAKVRRASKNSSVLKEQKEELLKSLSWIKVVLFIIMFAAQIVFATEAIYPTKPKPVNGNYFLHTGFIFDAVLETAIFSYNNITPVLARVEYDVRFLDTVVLPKKTLFIGVCSVEKSADRVHIVFQKIVFPNGQEIDFNGIALHVDGSGGVPGKVTKTSQKTLPVKTVVGAGASAISAAGNPIASGLAGGLQNLSQNELNNVYDYYITIQKMTAIQIFVMQRKEY